MTKWEYRIEKVVSECAVGIGISKPTDIYQVVVNRMNELGEQGWELVGVGGPLAQNCNPPVLAILYLKRLKS